MANQTGIGSWTNHDENDGVITVMAGSTEKRQRIDALLVEVRQRSKITQRAICALVGSVVADAAVHFKQLLSLKLG